MKTVTARNPAPTLNQPTPPGVADPLPFAFAISVYQRKSAVPLPFPRRSGKSPCNGTGSGHSPTTSRAWYGEAVADFLACSPDSIVGALARNADFAVVPACQRPLNPKG